MLSCRGEKKNGSHCAVLVRPRLGGCLGVILRERGPPSTMVGSSGKNMLWFCFLLLCGPGCTQDLEIAPCRENKLPTMYQCYPTIHSVLKLPLLPQAGQKVPCKAATQHFIAICCHGRFLHLSSSRSASGPPSCQPCWWSPFHLYLLFLVCFLALIWLQFSSVAQSCLTLCNLMNHSMPGLPVHHQLPESTQTHVHQVGDAIQPFHPLSSPSPPAPNPSQHQGLFQWVNFTWGGQSIGLAW